MNNLLEFVRDIAPINAGVDPNYGNLAAANFWVENLDIVGMRQEDFSKYGEMACRERFRQVYMSYGPLDINHKMAYEHDLDIGELCTCYHRQDGHGENWQERIDYLEPLLSEEEKEFAKTAWWSG